MSGSIRIVEMPDLGAITDSSSVVGEHVGSGRFTGLALKSFVATTGVMRGQDYGIKADGVTDDTAALTAAIAAAMATVPDGQCAHLVLPKGRIITGPQTITNQILIRGAHDNSTVLVLKTGSTAACLTIAPFGAAFPAGAPRGRIVLQDLRIESQTVKSGSANAHGVAFADGTAWTAHVTLQRVTVYGMPGDGINGNSFDGWADFYDCSIFNNLGHGVLCNSCDDWHWYGGDVAVNTNIGVQLSGCADCVIDGTNVYSNGNYNLYLFGAAGTDDGRHSFSNCAFDRGGQVGVFYDMRGLTGATFMGCTFHLCSQTTPNGYSDVVISTAANNLAMFTGCFWGNNYANDATQPEKWALEFQTTTNTVVVDAVNTFKSGTFRCSAPTQVIVSPGGTISGNATVTGGITSATSQTGFAVVKQPSSTADAWTVFQDTAGTQKGVVGWNHADGATNLANDSGFMLRLTGSTFSSTFTFQTCPGGGPWTAISDARIKEVHGEYTAGLDQVLRLRPVSYVYKGNDAAPDGASPLAGVAKERRQFVGLVAQDVEPVFPDMVSKGSGFVDGAAVDDMRSLNTGELVFALVNAVKTLADRLDALEAAAP